MAGGPPYTQLDMPQVIKQVYDTSENRLRVDVGTINMSGDLQVSIDAASDSVKIGDGTGNFLAVNSDGSINVNGGGGGGGNPAAGPTGSAVPADASYTGFNSGGNLVGISTANPLPVVQQGSVAVTGTFFQATQPVSATSLPLPTGAATSALQTTINTTLGTPFQAGGSIANTAFGISGTLPAYASTPTFNLGTLNGAATNAELITINTTLGIPFQSGGSIGNASFGATQATAANLNATVVGPSGVALAKDSSLTTINTTLGSPFQAGASIGNSSFGISGTLPAYAATPTFNVGTTNGIALDTTLSALSAKFNSLGQKTMANSAPVVISSDQSTLPVSLSSSPLPSGAATSAKQPALGVAGTASSDVITVQGIASMTALKVDGSAVVQPVSINVNTNGSASNSITVGSGSATTFTAPTNAVGFVVESESSNTVNLRYACGTTATTTVGMLLEPGRDSGYIPSKGTVTIIALTGSNQSASIQWVLSS